MASETHESDRVPAALRRGTNENRFATAVRAKPYSADTCALERERVDDVTNQVRKL